MARIIANTYEILQEIGSGGGGIVYLGRHLRLGKLVVLKADRRTLSSRPEVLRREVDALKNLSYTYIPQVYDFLVEDGVVYTVMDYIEGESLDKPLKRGERFSQPEVVKWACQLLEALAYLHSRPPHGILHGDVKPANLMLTPQGDIRLIDFNIALALGEEGAVRVGFSRGYASPEHYGTDFSTAGDTRSVSGGAVTRLDNDPATVLTTGSASTGRRAVLLDARSDIYSAGATLYHLFTGRRPAADAREAAADIQGEISPAIAAILQKAMDPNPDRRYQTADEMLAAFTHLHENDPRVRRLRRLRVLSASVLSVCFLLGGVLAMTGLKGMEREQRTVALAETAASALRMGDVPAALRHGLDALSGSGPLTQPPTARAQYVLTDALGVYDLTDGFRARGVLPLESEPLKLALSPEGSRVAVLTEGCFSVFDTEHGTLLATLEAEPSALSDVVFLGEDTLLYAGAGALRCRGLTAGRDLWSGKPATAIALSADGTTAAAVYKDESLAAVYDTATGEAREAVTFHGKRQRVAENDRFADPGDTLFALSGEGRYLAVSFSDGGLRIFDLYDSANDRIIYDTSDFVRFEGGFSGPYFAFSAEGGGESVFAVINAATGEEIGDFADTVPFHASADEGGICVSSDNLLVGIDPLSGEQRELAYATGGDITGFVRSGGVTLAATDDNAVSFFNGGVRVAAYADGGRGDLLALSPQMAAAASRDTPLVRLFAPKTHPAYFTYDADYLHDEARVSGDGRTVMLFRYDAFRLYGMDGTVLADVAIPDAEKVYDQQFRREAEGSFLDVIDYSGLVRRYSAEDGSLVSQTQGPPPDKSLYEEFYTDTLRITSPLHGTPTAYDRETGALVRELEPDAFLTYVTQVGKYIVTEYVSAQGERYGVLLNADCEPLARLPNLCDITADGTLVFDDMMGTLRQSRVYSLQELTALAEAEIKEETA